MKTSIHIRGLSGSALKTVAIINMLIDHIGMAIIYPLAMNAYYTHASNAALLRNLNTIFRTVGRISFPIFCFLIVEGFLHTHDVKKYAFRLFLFALISEAPFDLAFHNYRLFDWSAQNVFFTLFIGLVVIALIQRYCMSGEYPSLPAGLAAGLITLAGCLLAILMKTDYEYIGVLMIVFFYFFHDKPIQMAVSTGLLMVIESWGFTMGAAVLSLIPIFLYNGKRGHQNKYFFYMFYPVHLMILWAVGKFILHV